MLNLMPTQSAIFASLLAFSLSCGLIYALTPLAKRVGLVDIPSVRKTHQGHIPLIGGIALLISFCFSLLALNVSLSIYRSLILSSGLIVLVGVLDDFNETPPHTRLFTEILIATILIYFGDLQLIHLGNLFGLGGLVLSPLFSVLLSILSIVGLINAYNMLDGSDGLLVGTALTQCLGFSLLLAGSNQFGILYILAVFSAALIGFACHNFPISKNWRAKCFLGDAGSMFIGLIMVWLSIYCSQNPVGAIKAANMLWIFALPIIEAISSISNRLYHSEPVCQPDKRHFHHICLKMGLTTRATAWAMVTASACCVGIAILFQYSNVPSYIPFYSFCTFTVLAIIAKIKTVNSFNLPR